MKLENLNIKWILREDGKKWLSVSYKKIKEEKKTKKIQKSGRGSEYEEEEIELGKQGRVVEAMNMKKKSEV